jgi:5'-nucleotidase
MDWEVMPVNYKTEDAPEFIDILAKYKDKLIELAVKVGATSVILDATSLSSRTKETNIGNFVADSYRAAVGADVALVNGGSIRADFTYLPGPLTKRDVLAIMPFNNQIVKVEMNGKLLRQVIEHGVARSGPGEDGEPGRFPQVSGVSFKFDAKRPAGDRITAISVAGVPVDDNKTYTLATSWFLVSRGGDGYTMLKDAKLLTADVNTAPRDSAVFEDAISNSPNRTIAPAAEGRIVRIN